MKNEKKYLKYVGNKNEYVTVLKYLGLLDKHRWFLVLCICGKKWKVRLPSVSSKPIKSCGCKNKYEHLAIATTTHGLSKTRIHSLWSAMKGRCYNPKNKKYHRYGGRGITICERWHDFKNFYDDMGPCPKGYSLDRIDVNGNYEPSNCRWADQKTQQNNRENNRWIEFNGKRLRITEWEKETGIKAKIIRQRLDRDKWSIRKALTTPTNRNIEP